MRHFFYSSIILTIILACNSKTQQQAQEAENPLPMVKDCVPGEDTINHVTTFSKDSTKYPSDCFYSIVSFIKEKGLFEPNINKIGKLKVTKETAKIFPVVYDSCNMMRWIIKNFTMKNMQVTTLGFTGSKKDKYTGFTPGLHFEEWKFANNTDRDSAMKIVETVYGYPNNIVMYEKSYSQFILDDKRIFVLETGAKFAEHYAIEYKKLIELFIKRSYNNR